MEVLLDPASPVRRHYAKLAQNLLSLEDRVRSMVVTSPETGAGCSSVCIGLGAALAEMGKRVVVVDCNLGRPNLHRMLGEPNFIGLTSCLQSGRALENYGHDLVPGLLAVPTGPVSSDPVARIESQRFVEVVRGIEAHRDIVILDAPVAEKVIESPALSSQFDGVLLVIHASRTSKNTAREVTDDLLDAGVNLLGVVLNGAGESV
ncbi:MAG TPA: CpsD/CapB family tyrosine-protein kinase [Rubrobacteraceae bacterium]|nr:CpsD/CapB family tyrosine-protein kinase [Rubrobacteraceae bacterium]